VKKEKHRMKRLILAHDLGTTGNKATLYDAEGRLVGSAFEGYETHYERAGWAEQDPEDWWRAVCASTGRMLHDAGVDKDEVACLVFSGQMMGAVALDEKARPLRRAIIWADQRATEQERRLAERVSPDEVYQLTGHRLSASYSLCKILWLRDHEPGVYRKAHKFVHAKDAVIARLTGTFASDYSDASGMNLYDLREKGWAEGILEAAELDPDKLPELHASTDTIGEVRAEIADEVGVPAGTPVVIGGGDGACAATGAGVVAEGIAYNYAGSSSWLALATREPVFDPSQRTFTWAHLVPDMYSPCGTMQAAGASYGWVKEQLGGLEKVAAEALGVSPYELLNLSAESSPLGAKGLLFLPYLLGERSPRWNPRARGAFIGLTVRHTRADMVRAVLEGVTLNLRVILDALTGQGTSIEAVRLIGGGARGRLWNRLMADIYGLPVQRLKFLEEATSLGAALAGGIGVGLYRDFSLAGAMNPVVETIEPDPGAHEAYMRLLPTFEAAYEALVPIYDRLAE
jgi:xylulokinase